MLRSDIRERYNIKGSAAADCCTSWCCLPCSIEQQYRELEVEEKTIWQSQQVSARPSLVSLVFVLTVLIKARSAASNDGASSAAAAAGFPPSLISPSPVPLDSDRLLHSLISSVISPFSLLRLRHTCNTGYLSVLLGPCLVLQRVRNARHVVHRTEKEATYCYLERCMQNVTTARYAAFEP